MTILNYTVNYIDIVLAVIIIASVVSGWCRGFVINIINFIRAAIGLFFCFYLSSNGAQPIYDGYIRQRCLDYLNEKVVTSTNLDEILANLQNFISSLPQFVSKNIETDSLSVSSTDIARSILTGVFEPIILALLKAGIFLLVFIVFFGATAIIIRVGKRMSKRKEEKEGKKSALKKSDMALGALFGLLKGFIIVLAITSVLMYILSLKDESQLSAFMNEVKNSTLISYINEINPFNAVTEGLI